MHARHIMFFALLLFVPVSAGGHVNERGMDYRSFKDSAGSPCCSNEDCYAAEKFTETVENGSEVIRLLIDRTWISVPRAYVIGEHATDGCSTPMRPASYVSSPRRLTGNLMPRGALVLLAVRGYRCHRRLPFPVGSPAVVKWVSAFGPSTGQRLQLARPKHGRQHCG